MHKMKVISLVGPSGCGKTSIIDILEKLNYNTLSDDYINSIPKGISNKDIISKWFWISAWFRRILANHSNKLKYIITDRCPLEVVPYATYGIELEKAIILSFNELKNYGVDIRTIYLRVPFNICFERCAKRFQENHKRQSFHENDLEYSGKVYSYYENGINQIWNYTLDANNKTKKEVTKEVINIVNSEFKNV